MNKNLCADCSLTAGADPYPEVTHCENCGLPIQPTAKLHDYTPRGF